MLAHELHALHVFYTAARLGTFSAAAEALRVTQPAVSVQVRQFEERLGMPLLERAGRHLRCTGAGEVMLRHTQRIFGTLDELERELAELRGLETGRLVLGASTTIGEYLLPAAMGHFQELHPRVELELTIDNTAAIVERVLGHELDLGFIGTAVTHEALVAEPYVEDEIVVIASPRHPLGAFATSSAHSASAVPLDVLSGEKLIVRERGSATRKETEGHLAQLGITPRVAMELGSNEAVKRAVAAGLGIAAISRHAITAEVAAGHVVVVPVAGWSCRRQFRIIYRRGRRLTAHEQAFLALIRGRND